MTRMDGWKEGEERTGGDRLMNERMNEWMNECIYGCMDQMDWRLNEALGVNFASWDRSWPSTFSGIGLPSWPADNQWDDWYESTTASCRYHCSQTTACRPASVSHRCHRLHYFMVPPWIWLHQYTDWFHHSCCLSELWRYITVSVLTHAANISWNSMITSFMTSSVTSQLERSVWVTIPDWSQGGQAAGNRDKRTEIDMGYRPYPECYRNLALLADRTIRLLRYCHNQISVIFVVCRWLLDLCEPPTLVWARFYESKESNSLI